jgi:hypothetical protein
VQIQNWTTGQNDGMGKVLSLSPKDPKKKMYLRYVWVDQNGKLDGHLIYEGVELADSTLKLSNYNAWFQPNVLQNS